MLRSQISNQSTNESENPNPKSIAPLGNSSLNQPDAFSLDMVKKWEKIDSLEAENKRL